MKCAVVLLVSLVVAAVDKAVGAEHRSLCIITELVGRAQPAVAAVVVAVPRVAPAAMVFGTTAVRIVMCAMAVA